MFLHTQFLHAHGLAGTAGEASEWLFLGVAAASILFFSGWLARRNAVVDKIRDLVCTYITHELLLWLHRFNVVAVVLAFAHVAVIRQMRMNTPFFLMFTPYTALPLLAYAAMAYRYYMAPHAGQIASVRQLDTHVVEVTIEADGQALRRIRLGQFVFVRVPGIEPLTSYHPISVVTTTSSTLTLAVSQLGDFSRRLSAVTPHTRVLVSPAYGCLDSAITSASPDQPIVMVAGGIGITPPLSLIDAHSDRNISLLYSVKKGKQILFKNNFRRWDALPNIRIHTYTSRTTIARIRELVPNYHNARFVLSGPASMIESLTKELVAAGVARAAIFYEPFSM